MLEIILTSNIEQIEKTFDSMEKILPKELDLLINNIADKVKYSIEEDMQNGLNYGTMNKKGGQHYNSSGKLWKSIVKQKVGVNEYNVFVGADRSEIAGYIFSGTDRMRPRPFFRLHPDISKYVELELQKLVK